MCCQLFTTQWPTEAEIRTVDWLKTSSIVLYFVGSTVGIVAFITAMTTAATENNPAGVAGLYAPLIALSVASMFFVEAFGVGIWPSRRWRGAIVGVGSLASAYLWIADEAGIHPRDPKLLLDLSLVWIAASIISSTLILAVILSNRSSEN